MLTQVAVEALYSATYVDNYLDSVENLPDDVQRHLSRIREIDVQYQAHIRDVEHYSDQLIINQTNEIEASKSSMRSMQRLQQSLVAAQELGDEKLHIVTHLQELIEHKTRQLDQDFKNLGKILAKITNQRKHNLSEPSIADYGRDEKLVDIPHSKEVKAPQTSPNHVVSPTTTDVTVSQSIFTPTSPNATLLVIPPVNSTPSNGQNGSAISIVAANPSLTSNNVQANNGTTAHNTNTNNGNSERISKRPRRTRTDTTAGAGGAVSTPVSSSSIPTPMEIDPSEIKVEPQVVATGSGSSGAGNNGAASTSGKQSSAQANNSNQGKAKNQNNVNKKKKRKATGKNQTRETREDTPPQEEAIDPDEPTYCLCDQISFGEMILCDNDLCPIEWFHFSCVALLSKPKGKWFCPNCRGDRPNIMKPKAQFLKELERYNKEKEEKT